MAGAHTSAISLPRSIRWGNTIPSNWNANISHCAHGSSAWCARRSVSQSLPKCTISSSACSSTALSSECSYSIEEIPISNTTRGPCFVLDATIEDDRISLSVDGLKKIAGVSKLDETKRAVVRSYILKKQNDATLAEVQAYVARQIGVGLSQATLSRVLQSLDLPRKKNAG